MKLQVREKVIVYYEVEVPDGLDLEDAHETAKAICANMPDACDREENVTERDWQEVGP